MNHQPSIITNSRSGFTLLESLISIAIFSIFLVFFIASFRQIFAAQDVSWERVEASFYAQEGVEVVYNLFQNAETWQNYAGFFHEGQSYQVNEGGFVKLVPGTDQLDRYTREIFVSQVYRNSDLSIVDASEPGSTLDPQIVLIESHVTWESRGKSQEVQFSSYFTQPVPEKIF